MRPTSTAAAPLPPARPGVRPERLRSRDRWPDMGDLKVTVDGRDVEAAKGELVIAVAERAGVYIPRFCYHPRMRAVGMCRMCLVNVDTGRGPALTASCVVEVSDGMRVDTQ